MPNKILAKMGSASITDPLFSRLKELGTFNYGKIWFNFDHI